MRTRELERRIEAYFASCDATRERVEQKNGGVQYRQVPYTLQGLAAETGLAKAELLAESGGASARARLLSGALRRIERHLVERALLGEVQVALAQVLLRELGLDAPQPAVEADRRWEIVLDDREGWSG